ncbi:MAG: hypothetical protein ACRDRN_00685 [Sciscionella sp.]
MTISADPAAHWWAYVIIALGCAVIGYAANLVSRTLMLKPVRFVGAGPIGWHGSVPRNAAKLATDLARRVVPELLSGQEIFSRLDPDELTEQIRGPLLRAAEDLTVELMEQHKPGLWEFLPERGKQMLIADVRDAAPGLARRLVEQIQIDVADVFDLEHLIRAVLAEDPALLARLTGNIAYRAFRFMTASGALIGLAVGVLAALLLAFTGQLVLLPIFGLITGLLARVIGTRALFTSYALRRMRRPMAVEFAAAMAGEIVTVDNIVSELLRGPRSPRLHALVRRDVQHLTDSQLSLAKPLISITIGARSLQEIKQAAADALLHRFSTTVKQAEKYAASAMAVRATVLHRTLRMAPESLYQLLRPTMAADSWRLTLLASVSGLIIGGIAFIIWAAT